jgi:hypothetical protein
MPINIVKGDAAPLWSACVDRFLDDIRVPSAAAQHAAHIWLTQRSHRDLLLEAAAAAASPAGWRRRSRSCPSCRAAFTRTEVRSTC